MSRLIIAHGCIFAHTFMRTLIVARINSTHTPATSTFGTPSYSWHAVDRRLVTRAHARAHPNTHFSGLQRIIHILCKLIMRTFNFLAGVPTFLSLCKQVQHINERGRYTASTCSCSLIPPDQKQHINERSGTSVLINGTCDNQTTH
jgi:hypothetical protein